MMSNNILGYTIVATAIALAAIHSVNETNMENQQEKTEFAYEFKDLNARRAGENRTYLPFLNVETMHCGIYHLKAGAKDGQSPHTEDEVYYVESGKGKFHVDGEEMDVRPGTILFVPAHKKHYFHDITEDLSLLVFFSKAPADKN